MVSESLVALITGGASGIGLAVVERLLELGWKVAIVDCRPATDQFAKHDAEKSILFVKADVSVYKEQVEAFSQAYAKWGRLDLVYANAGILDRADFCAPAQESEQGTPIKIDTAVIDVDLYGVVWSSYLALHYFRKNASKAGKLIMTSSTAGVYVTSEVPLYSAAKHGIIGLARSLGKRMKEEGQPITVNAIIPGVVATAILPDSVIQSIPAKYRTPASLIVQAIENIINDSLITGQAIECNGEDIVSIPPPDYINAACRYTVGGEYQTLAGSDAVRNFGIQKEK